MLARIDHPKVRVLLQDRNRGKGAAPGRGFAEATADYVVVQDADLEYDPAEYGDLLGPLVEGVADVVYGSRFISSRPHRVLYFWHSVGNRFLTTLSNMFTNLNLTDMETCYGNRREVVDRSIEEDRFGFEGSPPRWRAGWQSESGSATRAAPTPRQKIGWRDGVRAVWCILRHSPIGERLRAGPRPGAGAGGRRTVDRAAVSPNGATAGSDAVRAG